MSIKSFFDSQLNEQQLVIARQALQQAFRVSLPGSARMREILAELQETNQLWQAFQDLRFDELKAMIAPPGDAYGPPGPTRKRGVTSRRIVDFVRQNPGARRNEIMRALGILGGTASSQLRLLRSAGRLQGEGPERNLRYFVG